MWEVIAKIFSLEGFNQVVIVLLLIALIKLIDKY